MMGSSDDETTRLWKTTKLIVEANSYERMTLWERWVDKTEWQQHLQGHLVTVGTYRNRPVCVSLVWATIRGKVVCFLEATSELVDWKMIDAWLKQEFPGVRKVDAMNFGSELSYVKAETTTPTVSDKTMTDNQRLAIERGHGEVMSSIEICKPNPDLLKTVDNGSW